jgi:hypothetical protein
MFNFKTKTKKSMNMEAELELANQLLSDNQEKIGNKLYTILHNASVENGHLRASARVYNGDYFSIFVGLHSDSLFPENGDGVLQVSLNMKNKDQELHVVRDHLTIESYHSLNELPKIELELSKIVKEYKISK